MCHAKVTLTQIHKVMESYQHNRWFTSLPDREQEIICFADIVHPLSPGGVEETFDTCGP
jgi:hypothetical protein